MKAGLLARSYKGGYKMRNKYADVLSLVPQVFKSILCKIVDMPALPIVKHPINVYGHLYNECDTAKWEGRLNLLHGELFYPGTQLLSVYWEYTSWHVTISQWNMMVKNALKSSSPSILWHVLAFHRVLWCAGYWVIQANIYQSCLQRARMWRRESWTFV